METQKKRRKLNDPARRPIGRSSHTSTFSEARTQGASPFPAGSDAVIQVLLVEDSPHDAEIMVRELSDCGYALKWTRVENSEDYLAALANAPDIVLSDYSLPRFSGMEALRLLKEQRLRIPLIVVSGVLSDDQAAELIKLGASDFLLKDRLGRLGSAVLSALHLQRAREAQRLAQQGFRQLAAIVESSQDAIISRELDGTILTWNPAAERLFGWSAAEAIGRDISLINPPERHEAIPRREQINRGMLPPTHDTIRLTKDGRRVDVSLTPSVVKDRRGEVLAVSLVFHDITERVISARRRAMEHAITRVLADSATLSEAMPRLIQTMCEAMDWRYGARWEWNPTEQRLCRAEHWSNFAEDFEPADRDYWLRLGTGSPEGPVRRAWLSAKTTWLTDINEETSFRRKPSCMKFGLRSACSFPVLVGSEVVGVMEFFGRDVRQTDRAMLQITEAIGRQIGQFIRRKQAEESLYSSEEQLRAMFEQAAVGMALRSIDPGNPRWLRINRKLCEILGYSEEELMHVTFVDLTPPRDRDLAMDYNEKMRRGELTSYSREKRYVRKDGNIIWVNLSVTAVRDPDGKLTQVISTIEDISERKDADERIKRLNRVYAMLSAITTLIVRARDRQALFFEACRVAVEHGGFGIAMIGLFDPQTLEVVPAAWAGADADVAVNMNSTADPKAPLGQGTIGRAIRERRPVFINDMAADSGAGSKRREAIARGYCSVIALPLMREESVAGVLMLMAREKEFFNEEEVTLLADLAADISFALEHIAKAEKLDYLAYYDALTGTANRTLLNDRLVQAVAQAHRYGHTLAVAILNLDHFKLINDSLGHAAGDELLKSCVKRVRSCVRETDTLARFGGDEFVLVLPGQSDQSATSRVVSQASEAVSSAPAIVETLQRILESFAVPITVAERELSLTCSMGVSLYPQDGEDADTLLKNAAAALSRAKQLGRKNYQFYTAEHNAKIAERLSLHLSLRRALERDEFTLHYQPKINLQSGKASGSEALLRWSRPDSGMVSPAEFIPVLEETGLIVDVGRWVMEKAVATCRQWQTRYPRAPRIAVNVSQLQLAQKDFASAVERVLNNAEYGPVGLDFEITESLIMQDLETTVAKLKAIRKMGVEIAIDDFGTGHSSLSYLAKLPVNMLKIDRAFIAEMDTSPDSLAIVTSIISLAHALRLRVVAEGVENEAQVKILRLLRCDEMQGYVISRPLPENQFETWWESHCAEGEAATRGD